MVMSKNICHSRWFAWLLLLFIHEAGATGANPVTLDNSRLQLEFNMSTGAVNHWVLLQLHGAQGKAQDMAAPKGQLFLLSGSLAGKDLREWERQTGGWKVLEQRADAVVLGLTGADVPFEIKKTWRLLAHEWRTDFTVDLDFKDLKRTAQDHLELTLGPGVGEIPAVGLGMGQSIYSYTELVYHGPEGVKTLRLSNTEMPAGYDSTQAGQWDWVGLQSRYLAMILTPANDLAQGTSWMANASQGAADYAEFETSVQLSLPVADNAKGQLQTYAWHVFGGGKAYAALTAQVPDLSDLLFSSLWGWMRALSLGIMHVLHFIQQLVGSWGLAIILLAVLVRVAVYPIAKNAISSQKKFAAIQARIQPELQEIRRNYKGGEQSERILQLYESHKVSPLAGLKPLLIVLIQVPVFVALYHLLGQTFELRDASFLWIKTLAEPDQLFSLGVDLPLFGTYFNLLPVLMALTTLLSIKLNPAATTNGESSLRQALMSGLMGLGFFLLFYSFPSGMVLYWTVANILQVVHQKLARAG